jgi:hypothetical protein
VGNARYRVSCAVSTDGGITWQPAQVVDSGFGCDLSSTQLFNDKEWIVTDNNPSSPFYGRTYLPHTHRLCRHSRKPWLR